MNGKFVYYTIKLNKIRVMNVINILSSKNHRSTNHTTIDSVNSNNTKIITKLKILFKKLFGRQM